MLFGASRPRIVKSFNPIGREYQVHVKRPVSELDEVFAPPNLFFLWFGE
jgi:hypothetical protein